ncbi:hypothetical protein BDN72DRAFT_959026 [Pluteus cervinus]|uniref:Uncharacterized protein n=1 Tax=Pluteus cervinus TaxID=181527 RepID=A0ACD3AWL1_9AGAR|nr:hypothetical protein BDN72DRAFT_959026 [Pluteus cervinus]
MSLTACTPAPPLADLPQELVDHIFHTLAEDKSALKDCTLVSKDVSRICQGHLFRSVHIQTPSHWIIGDDRQDNVRSLLQRRPYLLRTVKVLKIDTGHNEKEKRMSLMKPFTASVSGCELEQFKLSMSHYDFSCPDQGWEDIHDFFSNHRTSTYSSLVALDIEGIWCFPHEFLGLFQNLRKLRFAPGKDPAKRDWNEAHALQDTLPGEGCLSLQELELVELLDSPTWFYLLRCINYSTIRKLTVVQRSKVIRPQLQLFMERVGPFVEELVWNPSTTLGGGEGPPFRTFTNIHNFKLTGIHASQFQDRELLEWIAKCINKIPTSRTTHPLKITFDFPFLDVHPSHSATDSCPFAHPPDAPCKFRIPRLDLAQITGLHRRVDALLDGLSNFEMLTVMVDKSVDKNQSALMFPKLASQSKVVFEKRETLVCWFLLSKRWADENFRSLVDDSQP